MSVAGATPGMAGFGGRTPGMGKSTNPEDEDAADEQLRVASAGGNVDEVVRRLDSGASHQSAARGSGNTALHEAAMAGHTEVQ